MIDWIVVDTIMGESITDNRQFKIMERDAFYEDYLRPLLFLADPEEAHELAHVLLRMFSFVLDSLPYKYGGTDLSTVIGNTTIQNPVGLAAGFDKNAKLIDIMSSLGFGFLEVGSITARPSNGNPRPRLFRLQNDLALINRMGLNGEGADKVAERLRLVKPSGPMAINIAKTHDPSIVGDAAIEDILHSFKATKDIDACYVALNASCPNTKEGCMKEKRDLDVVLAEMQKINDKNIPLFVKVSPDSSQQLVEDIVEVAQRNGLTGYICGNTTVSRKGLNSNSEMVSDIGAGGMSGAPLKPLALELCKQVAKIKSKSQQIIGCGGIASGADAYRFIRSGACAVELYTGLIYKGPSLPLQICTQLSSLLKSDGTSLKAAIGADLK